MMKSESFCVVCSAALEGRQRRFCSRACKNQDTNRRHQSYLSQQTRGLLRKRELVALAGGHCAHCGYDANLAALTWHHREPSRKSFNLDLRALSNRKIVEIRAEAAKCILLCANCHAEEHHPEMAVAFASTGKDNGRKRGR
ncbi:hypothetical protein AB7849_10375 [Rhodanobacter sp. 115]|uniref:hypothetical protein n=1 Tax=Rhodanobacter sp. FW021-MT20 TaxID=1162282 RepID=UPI0034E4F60E